MKNNNTLHRVPNNGRHALMFLSVAMLLFSSTALCLAAGVETRRYHESGVLTAVEGNSSVTINEKGYDVYSSVVVENAKGRQVPLNKLTIPSNVAFEYSYMAKDVKTMIPVIVYIKETKKPAAVNKRRAR
ncbi:MAG: hypothetical protein HGB35_06765 [Geobacteraceae bacterium]|nr:hypothetical protein [Geobacteraceae bacterium]